MTKDDVQIDNHHAMVGTTRNVGTDSSSSLTSPRPPERALYKVILVLGLASGFIYRIQAAQLDNWHWRNPTPSADELRSVCFGAQKFVAVGDGGIIHTSPDGRTWDDGHRIVSSALHKVIYANNQFIAVGAEGVILTSTNGYAWNAQSSGTTNALFSVAFANGKYVACGLAGQLAVSSDGSIWSPSTIGTTNLVWITAGNGLFVLPAPGMAVRVSPDGLTWTTVTFPPTGGEMYFPVINEAAFGNGIFVASVFTEYPTGIFVGPCEQFFTSPDGTNWTAGAIAVAPTAPNYFTHRFLSSANNLFLELVGYLYYYPNPTANRLAVSTDGMSASNTLVPPEAFDARDLTFGNGNYVLLGSGGGLWISTDLTNWVAAYGGLRPTIQQMIRGPNNYFAVANNPATPILASADGLSFSPLAGSPSLSYGAIGFDGTNYVAVAAAGALYTSTNGLSWVQRTSNTGTNLVAVCRGANRWVAVGANGTVITSPTSTTWTLRVSGTANALRGVAFGNNTYVAAGQGGTVISSADGSAWDVQDSGTTADLNGVQFLNGQFYAIGAQGTILSSPDGTTWQSLSSPVPRSLYSIAFGNGQYVACGYDVVFAGYTDPQVPNTGFFTTLNAVFQSIDGTNWQNITTKVPASAALANAAFLNGSFWLSGGNGAILQSDSSDGVPWLAGALGPNRSGFQLKVLLNCPQTYVVQTLTNLAGSWSEVATVTNPVSPYIWVDTNTSESPSRLYRIASP